MKISIAQNEIELAVQNYIRSMVSIAPGMEITIDFAATRGPEGMTANININQAAQPPEEEKPVAEVVDEPIPDQVVTTNTRKKPVLTKPSEKVVEEKEPEPAATVQTKVEEKQPEAAVAAADTQKAGTGFPGFASESEAEPELPDEKEAVVEEVAQQQAAAAEPEKAAEPEVAKKPSLFANLRNG